MKNIIFAEDYDSVLRTLGREYFVSQVCYVPNLREWSEKRGVELSEPHQFMKLMTEEGKRLTMFIQSEIHDEILDDIIKGLSMRLLLKDTSADPSRRLNSTKKGLAYYFLKEYARTFPGVGGDELLEDEWVMKEMENYGFFNE